MDEARGTPGITPESRIRGLEQQVEQLAGEVQHYRKLYTDQLTRCALLERGIIAGKKAERLSDDGQVEQVGSWGSRRSAGVQCCCSDTQ